MNENHILHLVATENHRALLNLTITDKFIYSALISLLPASVSLSLSSKFDPLSLSPSFEATLLNPKFSRVSSQLLSNSLKITF